MKKGNTMRAKNSLFLIAVQSFAIAGLAVWSGCDNNSSLTSSLGGNTAVVANTTNAFSYVLNANDYSSSNSYDLMFSKDSVVYSITATYQSGKLVVAISDSTGADILRDTVSMNAVIATTITGKIPKKCTMTYVHFDGTLSLAIAAGNTVAGRQ